MHIWWRSSTQSGYSTWSRLLGAESKIYSFSLTNITADRRLLPKISAFSHPVFSSVDPNEDIWFQITTDGSTMEYNFL